MVPVTINEPIVVFRRRYGRIIRMNEGRIDIRDLLTPPQKHELHTAKFFSAMGYDIKFIRPSNIPENYRGDFTMNGIEWEAKCPEGKGSRTIVKLYSKAATQSQNIVFDLRRCSVPEKLAISQLERLYQQKHTRRLMIITKSGTLIQYPENCIDK